jgi:tRNA 2-thiouridine synthesizing protein A
MSRHQLDCRRLLCPMPVIRTQNRVAELAPGDVLDVTCTDPGAAKDIPAWCRINGHELLGIEQREGELVVSVRVCAESGGT